ncbi:hypothetical protein Vafri_21920 [Volvox africanus]|uniref:RRM domain-containing protein n=1 Tax=Volvox africanus TaxID=51714 RepID=A0A8J4FAX9_9CHLO|nr:hypothetical protein Vafri_21920 [Volvox africanus]
MTDDSDTKTQENPHKVFVGGISYRMDEAGLRELFEKYNPESVVIQLDKMTQKPRGFGFVTFKDRESMLDAIRDLHNKDVDGRPISVKEAIPQDQIKPGTPASALGRGREGGGRYDRGGYDRRYDSRSGYDRYGGSGGYERGGYDRYGSSGSYGDPRQYDYGRGAAMSGIHIIGTLMRGTLTQRLSTAAMSTATIAGIRARTRAVTLLITHPVMTGIAVARVAPTVAAIRLDRLALHHMAGQTIDAMCAGRHGWT